jgi:hypothetical protein
MSDDVDALVSYAVSRWQGLQPILDAPPPRGLWIVAHTAVPADIRYDIQTPVVAAWYGSDDGVHLRDVAVAQRVRAKGTAWAGRPYHRWGWVDLARLEDEPVYYMTFLWGPLSGYGLFAAVTARGWVLTSEYAWVS